MNRLNLLKSLFLGVFLLCAVCIRLSAQNPKPFVIPELKEWQGKEGSFIPSDKSRIVYGDNSLKQIAEAFASDWKELFGFSMQVTDGKPEAGDFYLTLKNDKKLGKEGYTLSVTKSVTVSAPETTGVYWATRTLLQICEQTEDHRIPEGKVRDWPDYSIRGFMMDCGRKFIPMTYLRDLVKMMSYYKMNVLQVHLNDNGFKQFFGHDWDKTYAAFRLECETFPGLTARDGYYTKQEFVDFQLDAAAQFVEIIPEIDAPAHTLAFSHYKPELGSKEYGMDHLDLFNPETYTFMDALFKEYLEGDEPVFRGPRVHIGTDEYSNKKKDVVEKFRAFTDRYIRYVESFGKQACVWGALTHAQGDTPVKSENVIMSAWYNGYAEPKDMVKQGYKLISIPDGLIYIVPAAGYYYDYLNTQYLYENWTPAHVGQVVFEEKDPAILGGMFAVWNDHVGNGISVKDIHHRLFPALQTLATKTWDTQVSVPYEEFDSKRQLLSEAPGVNQLGRVGKRPGLVYENAELLPGESLPICEIGYGYTVTFDLEAVSESYGTELFRSPNAVFYLSDPVSGLFGFARDGYLNTFNFRPYPGEKINVKIQGDNVSTSLFIDGKLIEKMDIQKRYFNAGKDSMNYVRTLVFPLEKAGAFKSRITNLKVYNEIAE
ncbi:family 20 glycosylhydrolase [Phocaeicola barnesiae]|nr:family 20 glycosylhydrolase [Phocaeicola barnesiae]MDM8241225.1 family 20 glycosylhydrolase [Phocaeicola barnesiae]